MRRRRLAVDQDTLQRDYCWRQLAKMRQLCRRFYAPGQTHAALQAALGDRDDLAEAVRYAASHLTEMDADDGWWQLVTVEGVTFLDQFLPADAFRALVDALQAAADDADPRAVSRRCRALSAAAYGAVTEGRLDRAAAPAAAAYDLIGRVDDDARAFCLFCLAVVCRRTDPARAAALARSSLELLRCRDEPLVCSPPERIRVGSFGTMHDPNNHASRPPRMGVRAAIQAADRSPPDETMHDPKFHFRGSRSAPAAAAGMGIVVAGELLASILADSGATQSALNACRQSDEAGFQALDPGHPLAVRGYLVRQRLWSSVGLAERARQAAARAAESAVIYYAEEHPATGDALACLCESTSHRGPVDDAICDAIHALAVRIKVRRLAPLLHACWNGVFTVHICLSVCVLPCWRINVFITSAILSRHPRCGGEIACIGGIYRGSEGCASSEVQGHSRWSQSLWAKPAEGESFFAVYK